MTTAQQIIDDVKKRMDGALSSLKHTLSGLRTGRVSATILDPIRVEAYGDYMPLTQLATVNVPEPQLITVQVWDRDQAKAVEKAIREADLGLNPITEGQLLRIPVPPLSQERRNALSKKAAEYGEQSKVAVRNVRRDGMDMVKKLEKDKQISEDELHSYSDDIQGITDSHIKQVEELVRIKTDEILKV